MTVSLRYALPTFHLAARGHECHRRCTLFAREMLPVPSDRCFFGIPVPSNGFHPALSSSKLASRLDVSPSRWRGRMSRTRFFILLASSFLIASSAWADDLGFVDCAAHP